MNLCNELQKQGLVPKQGERREITPEKLASHLHTYIVAHMHVPNPKSNEKVPEVKKQKYKIIFCTSKTFKHCSYVDNAWKFML